MEDSVAVIHFETTTTSIRVLRNGEIYNPVEIREEDNLSIWAWSSGSRIVTSRNVERILGKTKANFGDIPLSKDVYVAEMCFDDMDSSPYFTIQL